jgi:hypothetical protein
MFLFVYLYRGSPFIALFSNTTDTTTAIPSCPVVILLINTFGYHPQVNASAIVKSIMEYVVNFVSFRWVAYPTVQRKIFSLAMLSVLSAVIRFTLDIETQRVSVPMWTPFPRKFHCPRQIHRINQTFQPCTVFSVQKDNSHISANLILIFHLSTLLLWLLLE